MNGGMMACGLNVYILHRYIFISGFSDKLNFTIAKFVEPASIINFQSNNICSIFFSRLTTLNIHFAMESIIDPRVCTKLYAQT